MKAFAVFAAILAVSSASPQILYSGLGHHHLGLHHGLTYTAAVAPAVHHVPVATKTQYHSQDELGQASFGHSEPGQAHAAVRDAAGGVRGTFSYISPEGIPFTTHYVADHNGYRVASNALPVAPSAAVVGPVDTPEVAAAKAQHAAAHAEALVRSGRKKRGLIAAPYTTSVIAAPAVTAYSSHVVAAPAVTAYSSHVVAAPALTHTHLPAAVTYNAAHTPVVHAHAAPAITYSAPVVAPAVATALVVAAAPAIAAPALRAATLTKVVNTPGHAVSYRVD